MPKQEKPKTPYRFEIPPFKGDPEQITNRPQRWINEYFLIEALLRTEKAAQAYVHGDKSGLKSLFRDYGIYGQDPLTNSHHALLDGPFVKNEEFTREMEHLGWVDLELGIRDLKVAASLTPGKSYGPFILGEQWGEPECLFYLRNTNPRFVCLMLDLSHSPSLIMNSEPLLKLLKKRHEQYEEIPKDDRFAFYERLEKSPFSNIPAWFQYFRCYDLQRLQGLMPAQIAHYVYKNHPDPKKAMARARKALQRAAQAVKAAEDNAPWPPLIT